MNRFILDAKTGDYLLFPDTAELRLTSVDQENERVYVSIAVTLSCTGYSQSAPKPNRPIVLTGESLEINRPTDPKINRFKFVKMGGLTGSITLVANAADWPEIKRRLSDENSYLRITYTGTSEEYWGLKKLASIRLSIIDTRALASLRELYGQLTQLRSWMKERSTMNDRELDEWLQASINAKVPVRLLQGSYLLDVTDQEMTLPFEKLMQSVASISASPADISLVWDD